MNTDRTPRFIASGEHASGPTLRTVLERAALEPRHIVMTASPAAVADELERWFAEEVLPLLRERGQWTPSETADLRSRLGLAS